MFCLIILAGPAVTSVTDRNGIVAGVFAAMAMGMQAVIVNGIGVGADATVAACALVLREVRDGVRVQGVPAREHSA